MSLWKQICEEGAGPIHSLSQSLALLAWRRPNLLQPISDGRMIFVSDYSGQHKGASHEAYSFLATTERALEDWFPIREAFRQRWLPDGRRISFKVLREPMRNRALLPFLEAASHIRGNLFTFLVDRRIRSFMQGGSKAIADAFTDCFDQGAKPGTVEKMFRLASFLAMLTAGLRHELQPSLWISDHDETLDSHARREGFARLSSYLTWGLTRWRNAADMEFGTTASPFASEWSKDAAAIPDLFAGAFCRLSSIVPTFVGRETWIRVVPSGSANDDRAQVIGTWMAVSRGSLRNILLRLELDEHLQIRTSAQAVVGAVRSRAAPTSGA